MLVGLVMDVVLVSLLAPVAVAGRKRKVPKTGMIRLTQLNTYFSSVLKRDLKFRLIFCVRCTFLVGCRVEEMVFAAAIGSF